MANKNWRIKRTIWNYDINDDCWRVSQQSHKMDSFGSLTDAITELDNIHARANHNMPEASKRNGEYAERKSLNELEVCLYGHRYNFSIVQK